MLANRSSGRPLKGEFADYGQADIDLVITRCRMAALAARSGHLAG